MKIKTVGYEVRKYDLIGKVEDPQSLRQKRMGL